MDAYEATGRTLIGVGLGGIAEGWLYPVLLQRDTGGLPFARVVLVDGKSFRPDQPRQHIGNKGEMLNKAEDRRDVWCEVFSDQLIEVGCEFITPENVAKYVTNGSVVMLSPDNHKTRKCVSAHAETLADILLVCGGNDAVDDDAKTSGQEAVAMVHYRRGSSNVTPPLTRHHPDIAEPDDMSPHEKGCAELTQAGIPQVLNTNLLAGSLMVQLLHRYCSLPCKQATEVVEMWGDAKTGVVTPYGLDLRPV